MNKREKELLKLQLLQEKDLIKDLKKAYSQALNDIQARIKELMAQEEIQSKIYRKQYLKALETQLNGIINVLEGNNVQLITERLIKAYENGYLGSLYIMHDYGIPLIFGIDEKRVMTIVLKPIEKMTFANRIGQDMKEFKKKVKSEISRGIASNASYGAIAKQIELRINENFNRSYRIAQTEMGRVSSESQYDGLVEAQNQGCEIIKQWCATLDDKTRPDHAALDGQIREIDEYFTIGNHKALHPHGFGVAKLDINCRCTMLEKPKWALDESELDRLKERATYYKLDKTKDFDDFKAKYLKAIESVKDIAFKEAKTIKEAEQFMIDNFDVRANYKMFELEFANAINREFSNMKKVFGDKINLNRIKNMQGSIYDGILGRHAIVTMGGEILEKRVEFLPLSISKLKETIDEAYKRHQFSTDNINHTIRHELGHNIEWNCSQDVIKEITEIRNEELKKLGWLASRPNTVKAKEKMGEVLSAYGYTNTAEFIAESVAEYMNGNPRPIAKKVTELLINGGVRK